MKKIFLLAVCGLFIGLSGTAHGLSLQVRPDTVNLASAGSVTVAVYMDGVSDLGAFQLDLRYDPDVLEVRGTEDIEASGFLGATGRTVSRVSPTIDNDAGRLTIAAFSMGQAGGPSGDGTLATVRFRVKGNAGTGISLEGIRLTDTGGTELTVDLVDNAFAGLFY